MRDDDVAKRLHAMALGYARARMGRDGLGFDGIEDIAQSSLREMLTDLRNRDVDDLEIAGRWIRLAIDRKLADRHRYHTRQRRSGKQRLDVGVEALPSAVAGPDAVVEQQERAHVVSAAYERALQSLDPQQRLAIELLRQGATYAEIGRRIDRTPTTARMFVCRARGRLGLQMQAILGEHPLPERRHDEDATRPRSDSTAG